MEKGHAVYSTQTKILRGLIWVFMLFMAVLMIFPVIYIVFGSFKGNSELLVGGRTSFRRNGCSQIIQTHGSRQILPDIQSTVSSWRWGSW